MKKIIVICLAFCFVLALSAMAFDDMGKSATVNGWVSDDKCGVKGANAGANANEANPEASKDQKVLAVDNPDALKGHEGHHIAATGSVKGDTIHVDSVKML